MTEKKALFSGISYSRLVCIPEIILEFIALKLECTSKNEIKITFNLKCAQNCVNY